MFLKKYINNKTLRCVAYIIIALALLTVILTIYVFGVNFYVKNTTKDRILSIEDISKLEDVDCILVLGCYVKPDGVPSDMLRDRLETGLSVYATNVTDKILMSGDHGQKEYDEVTVMKDYAVERGVLSSDVFCDHAGFSTYESLYRAKEIFGTDKIIIVTQKYHLYRALYTAEALGIEAYGVPADLNSYAGQWMRDVREVLARNKDFLTAFFKPEPTYLGDSIPINGNGDTTNG